MAFTDKFRSILKKGQPGPQDHEAGGARTPAEVPQPRVSKTLEDVDAMILQERKEGEARVQAVEREMAALRLSIEKSELVSKTNRETHQQALSFLQEDAERELRFLERKLQEDAAAWNRQVAERQKALEHASRQAESGQLEKKAVYEKESEQREEALERVEQALKDHETALLQERQRWQEVIQVKDAELMALKQELARKEAAYQADDAEQENQRRASQELWQTRLKELERQWQDRRKTWEDAMKAKEEERARLQNSFQERQASWQLEQERRLQDLSRRQERAAEKLAALQAHLAKEAQAWQQLMQQREEQAQQLKVKLVLSETEYKTHLEQAQRRMQEAASAAAAQAQAVQRQLQEEQDAWKKSLEEKDVELRQLQGDIRTKLRTLESSYHERVAQLSAQKEDLGKQLQLLEAQHQDDERQFQERTTQLSSEQGLLQAAAQRRLEELKRRFEEEGSALETQIASLERQRADSDLELESLRVQWREQLAQRDQALKDAQAAIAPQEAEIKKRYAVEEEAVQRQSDGIKSRLRILEREIAKIQESADRSEEDHRNALQALQADSQAKEDALRVRSTEHLERLTQKLEEKRNALDNFLAVKREEESKAQAALKSREAQRQELAGRLARLPQKLDEALAQRKQAATEESVRLKADIAVLEKRLAEAREQTKGAMQARATQLAGLRQTLDQKEKALAADIREREQVLEAERSAAEKQLAAARTELDRLRAEAKVELERRTQQIAAMEQDLLRQTDASRQRLEQEQKSFEEQRAPLLRQKDDLTATLERERLEHDEQIASLEKQAVEVQQQIHSLQKKTTDSLASQEERFRSQRAAWQAGLNTIRAEQHAVVAAQEETSAQKAAQIEKLEQQLHEQALSFESRRRDAVHQAAVRSRTLQDMIDQLQREMKISQDQFPRELKEREETIVKLNAQLTQAQAHHEHAIARYDRAHATLKRRGEQKQQTLRAQLAELKEEWAKRISVRDAEIAALQADLLAKESERQGELDRLAKQFAEERFQLEKSKEELEWKLKDLKEVSERQLSGRQKEILFLESEVKRLQTLRDEQLRQKAAAFEAERQSWHAQLDALQKQYDDERQTQESALGAKEQELRQLLAQSKHRLKVLGDEFTQKVNLWRTTNEALRVQIEQLKSHWAQAQEHWETLRKEKANEMAARRQELTEWESRIQNDLQAQEALQEQERQDLQVARQKKERELEEMQVSFQRQMADKEDDLSRALDEVSARETASETQWQSTLEQWEVDKQALQKEKARFEHDLVQLQRRAEQEIQEMENAMGKLRMEMTFKETQAASHRERIESRGQKELQPLRERLTQLSDQLERDRAAWESRLRAKEEDVKMSRARLAWREKRVQDEIKRREKDIADARQLLESELTKVRTLADSERRQIDDLLREKREALQLLQRQQKDLLDVDDKASAQEHETLASQRQELEEGLRRLLAERETLQRHYEALLQEQNADYLHLQESLKARDAELNTVRGQARETTDEIRRRLETLRQSAPRDLPHNRPKSAPAWSALESGVAHYQGRRYDEALKAFLECIRKDPRWGAAHQYLALVYQAQGQHALALVAAQQALEQNPGNPQLGEWVQKLKSAAEPKKKAS